MKTQWKHSGIHNKSTRTRRVCLVETARVKGAKLRIFADLRTLTGARFTRGAVSFGSIGARAVTIAFELS